MTDPPASHEPGGTSPPGSTGPPPEPAAAGPAVPDSLFGAEEVLAALTSSTQGQPAREDRDARYDDDDDGLDDGWLAAMVTDPGAGFSHAGPLDQLAPGGALAGCAGHAVDDGLGTISDDALIGLLRASRRVAAWQSGVELAAVAERDRRRLRESGRPGWSRVSETIAAELAAALVVTGRSADSLLGLARDLTRLPAVLQALLEGRIDRARAMVFAAELAGLDDQKANAAAGQILPRAGGWTTSQLRHALRTLIHLLDPAAVRRRQQKAREDARVEAWQETSGNHGIAGRELDPAQALAADQRITAIARGLQAAGADGTLDQLRASVFTALLSGQDPDTLIPQPEAAAEPGASGDDGSHQNGNPAAPAHENGSGTGGKLAQLGGTVHLTLPASTWLGLSDLPGEAAGAGPIDAWTSRRLANRAAASHALSRWCITLISPDGTAAAHACTRTRPPAGQAARQDWLTRQDYTWLDGPGRCRHGSKARGYQPSNGLCDLVKARNRTCTFPGCRRPATRCDLDHTIPYDQGGRTCPCNLSPLCRQHHRVKQAPGWTLTQAEPGGTLTWTAPHGRTYTTTPSVYIC
jgi:hypothetical protein